MGRDKGKGRGSSGRGSGRKMFIANEDELQLRDREVHEAREARIKRRADDGDAVDGGNEDDDEDEDEEQPQKNESVFGFQRMSRAEAIAAKKLINPNNDEDDDDEEEDNQPKGLLGGMTKVNPNRQPKPVEKMIKIKDLNSTDVVTDPEAGMNRKERDAAAALRAKEEWQKKHMAGETEQARLDLERLAIVRKRREEAAKKREVDGRAPGWTPSGIQSDESSDSDDSSTDGNNNNKKGTSNNTTKATTTTMSSSSSITATSTNSKASKQLAAIQAEEKEISLSVAAKKKAIALGTNIEDDHDTTTPSDGGPPKLKSMDIKKMNGDQLKEHLKARKLEVQGQKKDLMKRLTDHEAARS